MEIVNKFEYKPTMEELAEEIWSLDTKEQAKLLKLLYNIDAIYRVETQLEYLSSELKERENKDGLDLVYSLAARLEFV